MPELQNPTRCRMRDTFELIRLTLWDEKEERLVRFGEAKRLAKRRMAA